MSKHPKVNVYDIERMFEKYVEYGMNNKYIKKPITWALYKTWKWADKYEKEREVNVDDIRRSY
jgi:hypothetical protein